MTSAYRCLCSPRHHRGTHAEEVDDTSSLRERLRARRRSITPNVAADAAAAVALRWGSEPTLAADDVALYVADDGEVDPTDLSVALRGAGTRTWYPVPLRPTDAAPMVFRLWDGVAPLRRGRFGIPVPQPSSTPDRLGIDLEVIAVPLVAFDRHGNRVGRGAGYYDRVFAPRQRSAPPPLMVGLAYDIQEVPILTARPWDVPLDAVVSPTGVRFFERQWSPRHSGGG